MKNNIILMGMKHCGKSSLGKLLARDLSYSFFDLDNIIIEEYKKPVSGVREIYLNYGKEHFQELEAIAAANITSLKEKNSLCILALGGGTIENTSALKTLENFGSFVYLKVEPEILFERIKQGGIPPFLSKEHPYEDFLELYKKRCSLYEKKADIIIELNNETLEKAVLILKNKILEENHAW